MFLFVLIAVLYSVSQYYCVLTRKKTLSVSPLYVLNRIDTIRSGVNVYFWKSKHYLVSGYQDDSETEKKIDILVCEGIDSVESIYGDYSIYFFKESKITNNANLYLNPRDLARYSQDNDYIYLYRWNYGNFAYKEKHKGLKIMPSYQEFKCR